MLLASRPALLVVLLATLASLPRRTQSQPDTAAAFFQRLEQTVFALADAAKSSHIGRCRAVSSCQCSTPSCAVDSNTANLECSSDFPPDGACVTATAADNTNCTSRRFSIDEPMVRAPRRGLDVQGNPDDNPLIRDDLCGYGNTMPSAFREWCAPGNSTVPKAWCYVGSPHGAFSIYPGQHLPRTGKTFGECSSFDPRVRPWYAAASSGPKDVVFVLDVSKSMNDLLGPMGPTGPMGPGAPRTRLQLLKLAVDDALNTLSPFDRVAMVAFNDGARTLVQDELVPANEENLGKLRDAISNEAAVGGTDFMKALQQGFALLRRGDAEVPAGSRRGAGCTKVMLFLTDGADSSCNQCRLGEPCTCAREILAQLKDLQAGLIDETGQPARLYTYTMSRDADEAVVRQMACLPESQGIWGRLEAKDDPLIVFSQYYRSLAVARNETTQVYFSPPYQDFQGLGTISTAAFPIYEDRFGYLTGVVGVDILVDDLRRVTGNNEVDAELARRGQTCSKSSALSISPCQRQLLRGSKAECPQRLQVDDPDTTCCTLPTRNTIFFPQLANPRNWADAQRSCEMFDGRLATISSDEENAYFATITSEDGAWIGLRKTDDSFLPKYFSPAFGEDEDQGSFCVAVDARGNKDNFILRSCSQVRGYICEVDTCPFPGTVLELDKVKDESNPPIAVCNPDVEEAEPAACFTGRRPQLFCDDKGSNADLDADDGFRRCCSRSGGSCNDTGAGPRGTDNSGGSNAATIAGAVVGALLVAAIAAAVIVFFVRRRRDQTAPTEPDVAEPSEEDPDEDKEDGKEEHQHGTVPPRPSAPEVNPYQDYLRRPL